MWHRLDFKLTQAAEARLFMGAKRSGTGFRKALAALNTKYRVGLPPEFFGYGADGQPDSGAEITFGMGSTASGLSIAATGASASALLVDRAGAINAALMHAAQELIPMSSRGGEHEANFLPFSRRHFVSNLAVGNQKSNSFWARAATAVRNGSTWMQEADRKIPLAISRGLLRQAVLLAREGDDLDGNVAPLLAQSMVDGIHWKTTGQEFGKRLNVKVHSVGGHTFVKLDANRTRLVLKNIEFTMHGQFDGPWYVGRLKIEGQGLIVPAAREWLQQACAA